MRKTSVEFDGGSSWLRVVDGRDDGWPAKELAAVLHLGGEGRQFVKVVDGARVVGADVLYRVLEDVPGHVFEKLADRGLLDVDVVSGLALVRPGGSGA